MTSKRKVKQELIDSFWIWLLDFAEFDHQKPFKFSDMEKAPCLEHYSTFTRRDYLYRIINHLLVHGQGFTKVGPMTYVIRYEVKT